MDKVFKLNRLFQTTEETIGALYDWTNKFLAFTLEDEFHEIKQYGDTRIPAGKYEIKLRTSNSTLNIKYCKRFNFHKGMLWLQNVPNFSDIYIHIGNTDEDTKGCILVGGGLELSHPNYFLEQSTEAYLVVYRTFLAAFIDNDKVFIDIIPEPSIIH